MVGNHMPAGNQIVKVEVRSVVPTSGGAAVFLGGDGKVIVIYIDNVVGMAIMSAMRQEPRERPQTHDLINSILAGFGAKVDRVVINDFNSGVFYARLFVVAENELYERKILEIDARPSDSLALALAHHAPVYVVRSVWDGAEDVTALLASMEAAEGEGGPAAQGGHD